MVISDVWCWLVDFAGDAFVFRCVFFCLSGVQYVYFVEILFYMQVVLLRGVGCVACVYCEEWVSPQLTEEGGGTIWESGTEPSEETYIMSVWIEIEIDDYFAMTGK